MAQTIKLKRSATQNAVPSTSSLALGEIALNTYDGKLFIKKNVSGTESIVTIGAVGAGSIGPTELASTAVTAGSYGSTSAIPVITIDADGRITSASTATISGLSANSVTSTEIAANAVGISELDVTDGTDGQVLTTDGSGTLTFETPTGGAASANAFATNVASGNGSTATFTLSSTPSAESKIIAFINGVFQNQDAYTISGTDITFDTAPISGTNNVVIYVIGDVYSGESVLISNFDGDSSTTAFTLSNNPGNENNTQVYIDGVYQQKTTYSVSGTTLTFSSAPPTGTANIEVVMLTSTTVNTPAAGSVVTASMADDSVTGAKIVSSAVTTAKIADSNVTTAKIADSNVTTAKIADANITTAKIANDAVTIGKIADAALVIESEGISSNDNDTTLPTSAAVKDYVDTQVAGKDALSELSGDTDDVTEGSTNLYFTNARADARITNALKDEDNMASNSATHIPSQQSVKAYVDSQVASKDALSELSGDTDDVSEGSSNLYYTDARVGTYISGNRTYGNITTTGYLAGPSTFTIDPAAVGDNTGTLVIAGNLQVDGTTTTINSTTMTVDDLNITLASGAANASAANGAGITVDGASATITYDGTNDEWDFNKDINVTGTISSGAITSSGTSVFTNLDISGNVDIDGTLETDALTIGGVTSVPFESADHSKLNAIEASADVTPSWVPSSDPGYLTSSSTQSKYLRSDTSDTMTGTLTVDSGTSMGIKIEHDTFGNALEIHREHASNAPAITWSNNGGQIGILYATDTENTLRWRDGTSTNAHLIFHAGNSAQFTSALNTKLSGIETGATADQTAAEIRTLVESASDSNVFTDADHSKLNGIAANANNYVLPTNLAGDDINIDTGALTGATVISDLDFNITTNTSGLVTDANASVATRTLTLANLGYTGATDATNNTGDITAVTTSGNVTGGGTSGSVGIGFTSTPSFTDVYVADQIIHSDDADTYTQFHAANEWRVVAGGYERFAIGPHVVVNEDSHNSDFRVESNGNANMLFVDGGNNRVGVGINNPTRTFEVNSGSTNAVARFESTDSRASLEFKDTGGTASIGNIGNHLSFLPTGTERMVLNDEGGLVVTPTAGGHAVFNEGSVDADFRVESNAYTHALFVNGGTSRVGINDSAPDRELEVRGDNSSTTFTTGIKVKNTNITTNSIAGIVFENYDNNGAYIRSLRSGSTAGILTFGINDGGGIAESNISEKLRISSFLVEPESGVNIGSIRNNGVTVSTSAVNVLNLGSVNSSGNKGRGRY
ncbi:hypothetical protein OAA25_00405, partial [bacterium]|nr:hypothetical protein [bacterium]